jgi:hypothetical protein
LGKCLIEQQQHIYGKLAVTQALKPSNAIIIADLENPGVPGRSFVLSFNWHELLSAKDHLITDQVNPEI